MSSKKTFYVKNLVIDDDYGTISSDKTVVDAALIMKEKEIPDLVVLDKDNTVLGVIADHDIAINTVAMGKDPKTTKVVEAMYKIEPVALDTPVEVAFQRMQQLKVSTVPCVTDGKLAGVVTITDCWGYIPEKYEDYKGLLTVKDPKFANYWWTVFFTLFYFFFGIVSPALGLVGFFSSKLSLATAKPNVTFFLFDAHGEDFFRRYINFTTNSTEWLVIVAYGIVFLIVGLLSVVLILQWAYGDYKMLKSNQDWPKLAFFAGIANIIIIWLLFLYMFMIGVERSGTSSLDYLGVGFTLVAILSLCLAVFRDFAFKSSPGGN